MLLKTKQDLRARVLSLPKVAMLQQISTREPTCKATVEVIDLRLYRSTSRIDRHPALLPRVLARREVTSQFHRELLSNSLLISLVSLWLASSVDQELRKLSASARAMQQVLSQRLPWEAVLSPLLRPRQQLKTKHSRLSQRLLPKQTTLASEH